jgi:hypothetical protein
MLHNVVRLQSKRNVLQCKSHLLEIEIADLQERARRCSGAPLRNIVKRVHDQICHQS